MSTKITLFAICLLVLFISLTLFVIFGQITVRRLRKNPATKNELGLELMSGWDILNVAGALALPRWLNRKLRNTPLSSMYANADVLDKHTNLFDRALATVFYVLWVGSIVGILILVVLDKIGIFN